MKIKYIMLVVTGIMNNNVQVKKTNDDNSVSYDFWKVTYHNIDFDNLHEI